MHLIPFLKTLPSDVVIYDPCCGTKTIGDFLRKQGFTNIIEDDLYTTDKKKDYLKEKSPDYGLMIANIPFCSKFAFFKKAFKSGKCCVLLFFVAYNIILFR